MTRATDGGQRLLGLRTVIYKVADLDRARTWYRKALGIDPCFDRPYYVNLFGIIENPHFRLPGQAG